MEPLAHSARPNFGISEQSYYDHVNSVIYNSTIFAKKILEYKEENCSSFLETVRLAACLHDLGKLDDKNQEVLRMGSSQHLPVNHVDAGTAHLVDLNHLESAMLVYEHHKGLCSIPAEVIRKELFLRDQSTCELTNQRLGIYVNEHESIFKAKVGKEERKRTRWSGLARRLALSCLVDADHGNTARHYGSENSIEPAENRWDERLQSLDAYVEHLFQQDASSERNQQRKQIYDACRNADINSPIQACDSPVGTGKTTAVMAHLLQVAIAKGLRHIIIVLPYTNIIKQSVEIYRRSLILPGEDPEKIVAEHHHQADFSDIESRQMATLWQAPVIVTTAVQFFETLGGSHPAKLRKLHELPGSAVFVDETHSAIPTCLWPQTWIWLKELSKKWGCHFILASGTLPRFWQNIKFVDPPESLPDLIPTNLRKESILIESQRIRYRFCEKAFNRNELINFIISKSGPRLVIMNTVQSAAVIAKEMQKAGCSVLHLSTALVPDDRDRIIDRIIRRLKFQNISDWTLVATSCVEAGMNFSFRTAFRESCATTSLFQIGGRVNRHGNSETAEIWDFRVIDPLLNHHPAFQTSRSVLKKMFEEQLIQHLSPTEAVTEAMRREIMSDSNETAEIIKKCEQKCDYPQVAKLYRVINADTRIVVIDKDIIAALEKWEKVSTLDLLRNSIQLWTQKIKALSLESIRGHDELYKWTAPYDPDFLGFMAGVLPLVYAQEEGLII